MPTRTKVCESAALPEGGRLVVDIGARTLGIFRVNGQLRAWENICPHQGGPVCQGAIIPAVVENLNDQKASTGFAFNPGDTHIVCPWHGFEFSIATGCHPAKPSIRLRAAAIEESNGEIHVTL